jgi:hypothetical protein
MLLDQQRQINELRKALSEKEAATTQPAPTTAQPNTENAAAPSAPVLGGRPSTGEVASTTPIIPLGPAENAPLTTVVFTPTPQGPTQAAPADGVQKAIDAINSNSVTASDTGCAST